jgi:hypothetical protein
VAIHANEEPGKQQPRETSISVSATAIGNGGCDFFGFFTLHFTGPLRFLGIIFGDNLTA